MWRGKKTMSVSDGINIICAIVTLITTIIIAELQFRQGRRMEEFEKRQDKHDEKRHAEEVKSRAVSFISKHYSDRALIPLCAIAAMHNELFYYSREMYREYCCCTAEVQNRILEYQELDLRVADIPNFFDKCVAELRCIMKTYFPKDQDVFYDNDKYLLYSLTKYAAKPIPLEDTPFPYTPSYVREAEHRTGRLAQFIRDTTSKDTYCLYNTPIDDILKIAFESADETDGAIDCLQYMYNFKNLQENEIEACQFVTTLAKELAIYTKDPNLNKEYGAPYDYTECNKDTVFMEDLFLLTLFEIYTRLILK